MFKKYLIVLPFIIGAFFFVHPAHAAIAVDATSTSAYSTANPTTWSHTVSSSDHTILIVEVNANYTYSNETVTYNGTTMTNISYSNQGGFSNSMWYLLNPPTGTHTVSVTTPGVIAQNDYAMSFSGVNQTSPFDAVATTSAPTATHMTSTIITTQSNDFILDQFYGNFSTNNAPTADSPQTYIVPTSPYFVGYRFVGSSYLTPTSPGTYTTGWTYINPSTSGSYSINLTAVALASAATSTTPTISSFSASPTVVASAGTSTLSWNVTNASSVSINQNALTSTSTLIGSVTVHPTSTLTYTLTATNPNGTSTATTSVSVATAPTAPSAFTVGSPTASTLSLAWTASTPNNGASISFYSVYRGSSSTTISTFVATTTGTSYTDTGLSTSTTYWYSLTGTDSVGNVSASSTNQSGTTTSGASSGYGYYRAITVTSTTSIASGTNSNFPMLVSSTISSWASTSHSGHIQNIVTAPNGGTEPADLIFTATTPTASGTVWSCASPLNFETEQYSSSTGALIDWVSVPSESAGSVIYACYGASGVTTDQSNPSSTWNSNYQGVWHLPNGTTLNTNDSTANANNGTNHSATATSGVIDGAAAFSGSSQYIDLGSSASLSIGTGSATYSVIVPAGTNSVNNFPFSTRTTSGGTGYEIIIGPGGASYTFGCRLGGSVTTYDSGANPFSSSTPNLMECVYDSVNHLVITYLNGVQIGNSSVSIGTTIANAQDLRIGSRASTYYTGTVDELRFSNAVLSPSWILTEYNNELSPSTFYTVGSEQAPTPPVVSFFQMIWRWIMDD